MVVYLYSVKNPESVTGFRDFFCFFLINCTDFFGIRDWQGWKPLPKLGLFFEAELLGDLFF